MSEKKITKAECDKAVMEVMTQEVNDPNLKGAGKFLIPMVGMIFAKKISSVLFGSEDENKEDSNNG